MAKKEFSYRGKSVDELKGLTLTEFAQLVPSRQRRSLMRGQTDAEKKLLEKVEKGKKLKTHCRTMIITPQMIGKTVETHRGNSFEPLIITEEMIGHRVGEFSLTRKKAKHTSTGVGKKKVNIRK
jgi:small subunit ribosomal protein S19